MKPSYAHERRHGEKSHIFCVGWNKGLGKTIPSGIRRQQNEIRILEYEKILELDPQHSESIQNLGRLYKENGNFEKALKYQKLYLEQYPERER